MGSRETNSRTASTTWGWRQVKLQPARRAQSGARQGPSRFSGLSRWPRREPITLTVTYRGGAESWWLVRARGRTVAFPGHRTLEDVLAEVLGEI